MVVNKVGGSAKAVDAAAVEARAAILAGDDFALLRQGVERVGDLHFAFGVHLRLPQDGEDIRSEQIAPDYCEIALNIGIGAGFFDQARGAVAAVAEAAAFDDAVLVALFHADAHGADYRATGIEVNLQELRHEGFVASNVVEAEVVGEDDAEGVGADQGFAAEDGVAEAAHVALAGVAEGAAIEEFAYWL